MTKRFHMVLWAVSLVAVLAVLAIPADAAQIQCKVPFAFTVNGKTLPAGTYTVSTNGSQGSLLVRGFGHGAFSVTGRVESRTDDTARLVFHRYGDQYVLRQAWMGGGSGRELPESPEERELARAARSEKASARLDRVVVPVE